MDPDGSSFSPLPSTSSVLDSRLTRLSLGTTGAGRPGAGTGFLQDEDMSFALAGGDDDSFDFAPQQHGTRAADGAGADDETVRLGGQQHSAGAGEGQGKGKAPLREADLFFGGSMATSAAVPASQRFAPGGQAATHQPAPAEDGIDDRDGHAAAGDDDDEMEDLEGYTEDERARIKSLRSERDGLRGMNAVLEDMKGALGGMEGKMQVRFAFPFRWLHAGPPRCRAGR